MTYALRDRSYEGEPEPGEHRAPGRLPATAHLAPRTVVMRDARDGDGVAAGAEVAVERAASSSGAQLPAGARTQFEASLGADLSGVRVHTGVASAEAASAVGAHAYTVGNDIHFAAGRYAPGDPFGLHLLAHEVAHTQQQAGATPTRQHKLEVSSPGDAAELEADRAADAMVAGAPAAVTGGGGLARTAIHRVADPNVSSAASPTGAAASPTGPAAAPNDSSGGNAGAPSGAPIPPELRADAQSGLNQWQQRANQAVLDTAAWYSGNVGQFLSMTSSNPGLSWTSDMIAAVAKAVVGKVENLALSLAATSLGVEIGSAGGPPGMIAGFVCGKVASMIADVVAGLIKGPDKTAAQAAAAAGGQVNAASQSFFAQAQQGQAAVATAFNNAQKNLDAASDVDTAQRVRDWASGELGQLPAPNVGDRSLFQQMYAQWVLEHTQVTGPALGPGAGTDPAQWQAGAQNAPLVDGKPVQDHLDLFAFQTSGLLGSAGLPTDAADQMKQAAAGVPASNQGQIVSQFDGKPIRFTSADPSRFLPFLQGFIPEAGAPELVQDIQNGNFSFTVTPHLRFLGNLDTGDAAISVTTFDCVAMLPAHQHFVSHDPMDAGLPPVDFGSGKLTSHTFSTPPR